MPRQTAYRPTPANPITAAPQPSAWAASDETDELLDDIDATLEENELEVVRRFVQKSGQ